MSAWSRYRSARIFGSAIYYLLTAEPDCFSALHKLPTEEIYHFYLGDPVEMLLLYPDGRIERVILGQDLLGGQQVQFVVPTQCRAKGVWILNLKKDQKSEFIEFESLSETE